MFVQLLSGPLLVFIVFSGASCFCEDTDFSLTLPFFSLYILCPEASAQKMLS